MCEARACHGTKTSIDRELKAAKESNCQNNQSMRAPLQIEGLSSLSLFHTPMVSDIPPKGPQKSTLTSLSAAATMWDLLSSLCAALAPPVHVCLQRHCSEKDCLPSCAATYSEKGSVWGCDWVGGAGVAHLSHGASPVCCAQLPGRRLPLPLTAAPSRTAHCS